MALKVLAFELGIQARSNRQALRRQGSFEALISAPSSSKPRQEEAEVALSGILGGEGVGPPESRAGYDKGLLAGPLRLRETTIRMPAPVRSGAPRASSPFCKGVCER